MDARATAGIRRARLGARGVSEMTYLEIHVTVCANEVTLVLQCTRDVVSNVEKTRFFPQLGRG